MGSAPAVLVADDQPDNVDFLRIFLEEEGLRVYAAYDGLETLDKVDAIEPDLVLLDIQMPYLDGLEVCRRIRARPERFELPIVLLTANTDLDVRIRGKEVGCDEFLTKPVDHRELIARVRSLLVRKAWTDGRHAERAAAVAERDRLRAQLIRAERLVTLGTLAGGVGHELKNVTVVLRSAVSELREMPGLDPSLLADLEAASRHVCTHATNLLSLARPGSEDDEPLDVAALASSCAEMLRRCGRASAVTIDVQAPGPVFVHANRTRLEQLLLNLIANAADAAEEMRSGAPVPVHVRVSPNGARVKLAVVDEGPGMPREVAARVFEPYFTTKPRGRGTGLGLPVVRQIVETYGGTIALETEPGRGTSIGFDLPADEAFAEEPVADVRSGT